MGLWLGAAALLVAAAFATLQLLVAHWRDGSARLLADATIRVVDDAGAPVAGVPVRVRWRSLRGGFPPFPEELYEALDPSQADGFVPTTRLAPRWAIGAAFELEPAILGRDDAWVRLSAPTVLVVPPTGRVVVQLVDEQGAPLQSADLPSQFATLGGQSVPFSPRGRAEFGAVACGSTLPLIVRVQGWSPGDPGTGVEQVRGPQRAGEVLELTRLVPRTTPRLVGVVRHADGSPAVGRFGFSLRGGGVHYQTTVTADDAGRFSFLLGERREPAGPWHVQLRDRGNTVACEAAARPDGSVDVGELRFPK